jgi:hypothetical protein
MNAKNLIIAGGIGAGIAVFFSLVPFLNLTNCLCCAPYWASAVLAVWLYRRMTFPGSMTLGQGVAVGLVVGVLATAASFLLSLLGLVHAAELMNRVQSVVSSANIDLPVRPEFNVNCNCGVELIFGLIGGLIGGALFRTDKGAPPPPPDSTLRPMSL